MRQFLSPRFWLSIGALAGLFLLLTAIFGGATPSSGSEPAPVEDVTARRIDLVQWVFLANPAPGFALDEGLTTADLSLQLDGTRTMMIKAGTPGVVTCPTITSAATCTVAADLLGDAVLWFALVPGAPGQNIVLPGVVSLQQGGWVTLANGWEVRRASTVDRSCADDTTSLLDFVRTYGEGATATFSFEQQAVVRVTCPNPDDTTTTSTPTGSSLIIGTEEGSGEETGDSTPAVTTSP